MTPVDDLQSVFGPRGVTFSESKPALDLNGDGKPERVVLLANKLRGYELPRAVSELSRTGGVLVDGFAVFDGVRPKVPVLYQYNEYDGWMVRLDTIDGQRVLVSDGGRDHVQHVWGWWRYADSWPPDGWEARDRIWNQEEQRHGPWIPVPRMNIVVGKKAEPVFRIRRRHRQDNVSFARHRSAVGAPFALD